MKFVDELTIEIESGKGGDGMVAFRREKFVPFGGPSGGDGGKGGDVIFEASSDFTTLYELSFSRKHIAPPGQPGGSKDKDGHAGEDLTVFLPVGTLVYDNESGILLRDLDRAGMKYVVAKGGQGGRGNRKFVSSTRRAPRMAEKGEPGNRLQIRLELKLLADVGLIGLPNGGKSTLLRAVSNARPKVADYPFTTLVPCLGIVKPDGARAFCLADIPGLIEGAHSGAGLGTHFLKHVERTRLLLHVVDLTSPEHESAMAAFQAIMSELSEFNPSLAEKPMAVLANKMDLPEARSLLPDFQSNLEKIGIKVFPVSGATKQGLNEVLKYIAGELATMETPKTMPAEIPEKVFRFLRSFEITQIGPTCWKVTGREIERLTAMTDFTSDDAVGIYKHKLKTMGFLKELSKLEAENDDTISIGDRDFEYGEFFI